MREEKTSRRWAWRGRHRHGEAGGPCYQLSSIVLLNIIVIIAIKLFLCTREYSKCFTWAFPFNLHKSFIWQVCLIMPMLYHSQLSLSNLPKITDRIKRANRGRTFSFRTHARNHCAKLLLPVRLPLSWKLKHVVPGSTLWSEKFTPFVVGRMDYRGRRMDAGRTVRKRRHSQSRLYEHINCAVAPDPIIRRALLLV